MESEGSTSPGASSASGRTACSLSFGPPCGRDAAARPAEPPPPDAQPSTPTASRSVSLPRALPELREELRSAVLSSPHTPGAGSAPLALVSCGTGGVEELAEGLNDAEVLWALVRFSLGSGSFARDRVVLLHFNGDDCPPLQRARANALTNDVKAFLRDGQGSNGFQACIQLSRKAEVTMENVLRLVSQFFIVDHVGEYSSAWASPGRYNDLARGRDFSRESRQAKPQRSSSTPQCDEGARRDAHRCAHEVKAAALASRIPGHLSSKACAKGRDALMAVAGHGSWNWVLVGPSPAELPLVGGGSGSVDEMRACGVGHGDLVMFGLLRLGFGVGRLKRTKFVFVHLIGPRVSAVKRGQYNAVANVMENALRQYANTSLSLRDVAPEDLDLEAIIDRVRRACVVDDFRLEGDRGMAALFTVEAFREALAREQAGVDDAAAEDSDAAERQSLGGSPVKARAGEGPERWTPGTSRGTARTVQEALRLMTVARTHNWAIFRPAGRRHPSTPTSTAASTPRRRLSGIFAGCSPEAPKRTPHRAAEAVCAPEACARALWREDAGKGRRLSEPWRSVGACLG